MSRGIVLCTCVGYSSLAPTQVRLSMKTDGSTASGRLSISEDRRASDKIDHMVCRLNR
jgi:hypothetical protein